MKTLLLFGGALGLAATLLPGVGSGANVAMEERVVAPRRMAETAVVDDVSVGNSLVSGVVINQTDKTLEGVELRIQHQFLWRNEFHPGTDDPSRTEFYTLPGSIPSRGEAPFTARIAPLPERHDGHFVTSVE